MIWFVLFYLVPMFIMLWALLQDQVSDVTLRDSVLIFILVFTPILNLILSWNVLWTWWNEIPWGKVIIKRSK
jgi:hypothetical protein